VCAESWVRSHLPSVSHHARATAGWQILVKQ
jgi:hypothetical protein